jgi:hypothetical protein
VPQLGGIRPLFLSKERHREHVRRHFRGRACVGGDILEQGLGRELRERGERREREATIDRSERMR